MRDPEADVLPEPAEDTMPPALGGEPVLLGGRIRDVPEDFRVEEIPLVRPTGRGEYVVFQVEKRQISTFDVLLRVSKSAKVSENDVGYAGLKDTQAVTRQYLSVPRVPPERVLRIRHPRFRVLTAARHVSPVRIGHHRGNRFTIRIRGVDATRVGSARRAIELFAARGMPNAYGSQRFGVRRDGHLLGRSIVNEDWNGFASQLLGRPSEHERDPRMVAAREAYDRGDLATCRDLIPLKRRTEKKVASTLLKTKSPREAFLALGRRPRRIWIAAWQAWLFNRILERRVADGTYDRLEVGDVAALYPSGARVPVRDEAEALALGGGPTRAVPTGPLVGYDLDLAKGRPGTIEREVLAKEGVLPEAFSSQAARARGDRRPLAVPIEEASLEEEPGGSVLVRFVLPPGCFATVLLSYLVGRPV